MKYIAATIALCAAASAAWAQQYTQIKTYILSGTGFFVHRDGYVVTNKHVVKNCQRIVVAGMFGERQARITASDDEYDLALLRADIIAPEVAQLSSRLRDLAAGERVVVVGFPGEAYKAGKPVTKEATLISPKGPSGEEKWLRISDVVVQGNSGGPLFDSGGAIIGVIVAKAELKRFPTGYPEHATTEREGIAISLPTVKNFLDANNVYYQSNDAISYLSADLLTDTARRFIVNVRCEYKTERVGG